MKNTLVQLAVTVLVASILPLLGWNFEQIFDLPLWGVFPVFFSLFLFFESLELISEGWSMKREHPKDSAKTLYLLAGFTTVVLITAGNYHALQEPIKNFIRENVVAFCQLIGWNALISFLLYVTVHEMVFVFKHRPYTTQVDKVLAVLGFLAVVGAQNVFAVGYYIQTHSLGGSLVLWCLTALVPCFFGYKPIRDYQTHQYKFWLKSQGLPITK